MIDLSLGTVKTINWTQVVLTVAFVVLVASDVIFISKYTSASARANTAESALSKTQSNGKILDFTSLFIDKVLQSNAEISFDDRLVMENAVRDLKDPEISAEWQKFVKSSDEKSAQIEVTNLLKMLVEKAK
jgi:hypothetical protein